MANAGVAYVQIRGDLSDLNKQLVANLYPARFSKLGKSAGVALGVGLAGGLAAVGAGKGLFDLGKSFDKAFDTIRVGTGRTGKDLKRLQGDFKSVFKSLPVSMDDTAAAITGLNQRLGITGEPLQKLSKQILQLSRVTKTDVGTNVAAITRLFGDWTVKTQDQSGTLDKLFRLTHSTGIGLGDLSRLMVKFGSPLRTLGFDFETAAAMFGRFEREGVNLQTTLPGFKIALKNFAKPTEELRAKFKKFGVDADVPQKALQRIFELLKTLPKTEGTQLAFEVFGSRAASDMARAVKEGRFELDDLIKSMDSGSDTINKAETDTRDFAEQWQLLKNRIFVGMEPIASKFFKVIGDGMEELAQADFGKIGDDISASLNLGKVDFGPTGDSISSSLDSIKSIVNSKLAKLIGSDLLGTMKKQIAGIAQIFRGMANVIAGTLKLIDDLIHLRLGKAFGDLGQIFHGGIQLAVGSLRLMTAPVREIMARVGRALLAPMRSAWRDVRDVFSGGISGALRALRGMVGDAGSLGKRAGLAIAHGFRSALGGIREVANDIVGVIKRIPGRLGDIGAGILNAIKSGLSGQTIIPKIDPPGPGSFPGIKVPKFAKGGTIRAQTALALVGEEGPELAKLPAGKMTMVGLPGPEIRELPVGTRVFSHPETKRKLASVSQKIIQRLVPAAIRQPKPLVQRISQELGTTQGGETPRPLLSGAAGSLSEPRVADMRADSFVKGGIVRKLARTFIAGDRLEERTQRFVGGGVVRRIAKDMGISGFARGGVVRVTSKRKKDEEDRDPTAKRGQPPEPTRQGKQEGKPTKASPGTGSAMLARADKLDRLGLPYRWGGGHGNIGQALKAGFDCSGAVSYVLGIPAKVSGELTGYGAPGKGPVTVFANAKHTIMSLFGRGFGTSKENVGGGAGWLSVNSLPNMTVRHAPGVHTPEEGGSEKEAAPTFRHKGRFTLGQMVSLAKRAGFPDPALAAAVGYAESRGNTAAHNKSAIEDSRGLWQINVKENANPQFKKWDLSDAFRNVQAAFKVSKGGKDFKPWTMYTNNQYRQYLGAKGAPLPKGTQKGTPSGSSYADYLAAKLIDAEGTKSDPKDDIRWINRSLRYYRGVYRRNKAKGNWQRQGEAKQKITELVDKRQTIREEMENPEVVSLDSGLAKIGTGPNAFNLAFMDDALEQIELQKENAALTVPPDDDDSQGALSASLQDDIAAASRLTSVWEGVKKLTDGWWAIPQTQPPADAGNRIAWINQTIAKERKRKRPDWKRIHELQAKLPALQGPSGGRYIVGTIKQQIDAATNLGTARSELKSLQDEAGKAEAFGVGPVYDKLRAQSALASLTPDKADDVAAAKELVNQYTVDLSGAQASGDNARIAEAAEALKGAQDELKSLLGDIATSKAQDQTTLLSSLRDLFKSFGSNVALIPKFAKGGWGKGLALVGEEGPEIVELPVGSRVRSHPESKRIAEKMPGFDGLIKIPAFAKGGVIERQETITQDRQVVLDPRQLKLLIEQLKDAKKEVHVDARQTYNRDPEDRHQHAQGLKFEIEAALGGAI